MSVEFKLPDLGEGVESVDVVSLMVAEGDTIEKDQPLFEAETDKAVVEVPSGVAGTITKLHISAGDTVKVGQPILSVDANGQAPPTRTKPGKPQAKAPERDRTETTTSQSAPSAATDRPADPTPPAPQPADEAPAPYRPADQPDDRPAVAAAPTVRQFAREIGVDILQVPGTGDRGRISIDDVKRFARDHARYQGAAVADSGPRIIVEKLSKLRKTAAATLSHAWQAPHVTLHDSADTTELEAFRQQHKKTAELAGGRLTITPLLMKIVVAALKAHPVINAELDLEQNQIRFKKHYDLGIAVDTPRGLVVPVIHDVDRKSAVELAIELTQVGEKARDGKLAPQEMTGATFTISNLGSIGVGYFTPVINPPQVAILGVGRAARQPVWDEPHGQFLPRLLTPLSLSFDHRLVDGADGARFLRYLVQAIAQPMMLTLH